MFGPHAARKYLLKTWFYELNFPIGHYITEAQVATLKLPKNLTTLSVIITFV